MTPELLQKFNLLEEIRHRINFQVAQMNDAQFNHQIREGKWSAGQIIFHLVQVETFSINYVNKKLMYREDLKNTGLGASFRFFLLKFFLFLPVKYKAPSTVASVPDKISKDDLLLQWENIRKELAKLLDDFPPELMEKNIFKHLRAGRLNISQMMDFIHDHLNHHQPQIDVAVENT